MRKAMRALLVAAWMALPAAALAAPPPPQIQAMGVDEHLGAQIPPDLTFRDPEGRLVRLGDLFDRSDEKPILLVPAYYTCPMLCSLVLDGVARAVSSQEWTPGDQYELITFSFDPADGPVEAKKKQQAVLSGLSRPVAAEDWPFLTGDQDRIDELLQALGLRVTYDEAQRQFAHPAVVFVLTPDGRISRYLYGIEYPDLHLKLALLEASDGKTGTTFDKILMACFHYDPASRRYGLFITNFVRGGATLIGLTVATGLVVLWRRERKNPSKKTGK